jgi:enoyl-CoA hydratase/carnithine racemase
VNSSPPEVTIEIREGIAWITFSVPQKANALTSAMLQRVEQTLAEGAANNAVRAVVITGAGARAFSAGADLTSVPGDQQAHAAQRRNQLAATLFALLEFGKPSIAAVNGAACGAGMMLALLCDATVAAQQARFSLPEINKGMPTFPGITILSRRFGSAIAADLVLSGRFVDADEALRRGLVRQVVAADELLGSAQTLALTLSQHDAAAYAHNKRWLNRPLRDELAAAIKASADLHRPSAVGSTLNVRNTR